jgi:hypothetical protein
LSCANLADGDRDQADEDSGGDDPGDFLVLHGAFLDERSRRSVSIRRKRARLVRQCLPPAFDEMLTVADDAEKLILHYFRRGFERASGGAA